MIFRRRRSRRYGNRRDQRRFMRDMQRGGFMNALFGFLMFKAVRLVFGLIVIFIVLAICVAIAFFAS